MIKITINWETVSPLLQTISGTLIIEDINIQNEYRNSTVIFRCTINSSNNPRCTGFGSVEKSKIFSDKIFQKYKNTIDIMVDSYFRGVILKESDYVWVDK